MTFCVEGIHCTALSVPEDYSIALDLVCRVKMAIEARANRIDSRLPEPAQVFRE